MGTTTALALDQALLQAIGDWKSMAVTTAIAASTSMVSTTLQQYRSTADRFNGSWVYITDYANIGVSRYVADDDGTSTLTVLGGNLATDGANLANFRLTKFSWADRLLALNQALTEVYPGIRAEIDNRELVTGNLLPDGSFEDWSSTSAMTWYTGTNTTLLKTTTAASIRGTRGTTSAKSSATAGNGYFSISSSVYPRLLDLAGATLDFKAWAYPEAANDAVLVISTIKADGTTQTLTSTTTSPAGKWSLIKLEDQVINKDIQYIEFKFITTTNAKYIYWDSARVTGKSMSDYVLPSSLNPGGINQVYMQTSNVSTSSTNDDACDNIDVYDWTPVTVSDVISDGLNNYLQLPSWLAAGYRLRLVGSQPFETLSLSTDTISTDNKKHLDMITNYGALRLYSNARDNASGSDIEKFDNLANRYLSNYYRLSHLKMSQKPVQLNATYS